MEDEFLSMKEDLERRWEEERREYDQRLEEERVQRMAEEEARLVGTSFLTPLLSDTMHFPPMPPPLPVDWQRMEK